MANPQLSRYGGNIYGNPSGFNRQPAGSGIAQAFAPRAPAQQAAPVTPQPSLAYSSAGIQPFNAQGVQPPNPTPAPDALAGTQPNVNPQGAQTPAYKPAAATVKPPAPAGVDPNALDTDPILQRIRALGQMNVNSAISGGNAQRRSLLAGFGDPQLARQQQFDQALPAGFDFTDPNARLPEAQVGDELLAQQAEHGTHPAEGVNGLTTIGQLLSQHQGRQQGLERDLNARNLFYGSEHANELAGEERQYQGERASAEGNLMQQLQAISQGILGARSGAAEQEVGGYQDAYSRALAAALANGSGGPVLAGPDDSGVAAPGGLGRQSPLPTQTRELIPGSQSGTTDQNMFGNWGPLAAALARLPGTRTIGG